MVVEEKNVEQKNQDYEGIHFLVPSSG